MIEWSHIAARVLQCGSCFIHTEQQKTGLPKKTGAVADFVSAAAPVQFYILLCLLLLLIPVACFCTIALGPFQIFREQAVNLLRFVFRIENLA